MEHTLRKFLADMPCFVEVADAASFTRAAERLGMPRNRWTIAYTPSISVACWLGDRDNRISWWGNNTTNYVVNQFMNAYLRGTPYEKFPSYTNPPYSNRFFKDFIILQADLAVKETLEKTDPPLTDTPVLFLTGAEDVTASDGRYGDIQAGLLRKAGCRDVTSIVYPGFRHSILQEPGRMQVIEDTRRWLDQRF